MSPLGILIEIIGYSAARAVLPLLSFGWISAEPFAASPRPLRWPGYRRDDNGRIVLQQAAAGWIGLGLCLTGLLAVGLLVHALLQGATFVD